MGDDHGGSEIYLGESRRHDTDDALLPVLVVEDDAGVVLLALYPRHNLVGFLGHLLVDVFPLLVVFVDVAGLVHGAVEVLLHEQVHALLAILHTARGIDSRPYLEDDVAHGNLPATEPADVDDGLQAHAGVLVELLESVVGQDTVLVDDGHEVGGNAHGAEVEEGG